MSDYPRRRRLEPEPPKRGGLPIVPLVVLIVLGGLFLGGLLTKFFGPSAVQVPTPRPSFTPLPQATATFAPRFTPTPEARHRAEPKKPRPRSTPKAIASPHVRASISPVPTPSPVPPSSPSPVTPSPFATHAYRAAHVPHAASVAARSAVTAAPPPPPPVIIVTPTPAATASVTATPVLITGANSGEHAAAIVRAYIAALARGDSATAAGYLASGLPSESFVNPDVSVKITNVQTSRNEDGSYGVTAQIVTSRGTYLESFTLKMGTYGMQIIDHSAQHI